MKQRAPRRAVARPRLAIALIVEEKRWRKDAQTLRLVRRAARLALTADPRPNPAPFRARRHKANAPGHPSPCKGEGDSRVRVERGSISAVTILLADDARLKALNAQFRRRNKATNVLSFAGEEPLYLGDIAIAYETTRSEARAQRKRLCAHAAHLVVHGILHLFGYDHEDAREATAMETLETKLLAELGLADPYTPRPLTRGRKAA